MNNSIHNVYSFKKPRRSIITPQILFIAGLIITAILGIIMGILSANKSPKQKPVPSSIVSPTLSITTSSQQPTSMPTKAQISRQSIKLEILNGNGKKGEVKKISEILNTLGYNIISTGNADSFDYKQTLIEVEDENEDIFHMIVTDLSSYSIDPYPRPLNSDDVTARIIIGKE